MATDELMERALAMLGDEDDDLASTAAVPDRTYNAFLDIPPAAPRVASSRNTLTCNAFACLSMRHLEI
ncbi:hypothetical protein ACWCW7_22175 [Nocardia tengchongensis]